MKMKIKPFNLEDALAGKPVVTRGGKRVTDFAYFPTYAYRQKFYAVVDGDLYAYSDDGSYHTDYKESSVDLFMEVETVKKYIAYNKRTGSVISSCIKENDELFMQYSGHCDYQIIEFDAEI